MSRSSVRLALEVDSFMCMPVVIVENNRRSLPIQLNPVGVPDKRTFYLSEVQPAAVLGEIDRLFSRGGLRELEWFAVAQRFEPDLAGVHRVAETAGAAQKRHQLAVARQRRDFCGIIKVRKLL